MLRNSIDHPDFVQERIDAKTFPKKQEVLVMSYLRGIMMQIEEIGEDRIMPQLKEVRWSLGRLAF